MNDNQPSIWHRVCQLEGEHLQAVKAVYDQKLFPIEFRHYFATIIESEDWNTINPDNHNDFARAKDILLRWIREINTYAAQSDIDFLLRLKMGEIAANLNFEYQSQPLELIRRVKNVLETEMRVIAEAQVDVVSVSEENNPRHRDEEIINESLQQLIIQTRESDAKLRGLQSEQENFVIRYQESVRVNQEYEKVTKQVPHNQALVDQAQRNKEAYELDLKNQAGEILHKRQELMDRHQRTFVTLQELMAKVLQIKLVEWKKQQALQFNGHQACDNQLKKIQEWCEKLAEIVWNNRHQIKRSIDQRKQLPINSNNAQIDLLPRLEQLINSILHTLVSSSFIIERQPPQVIKTHTRFGAQVRLLIGNKFSMHMSPPSVRAVIVNEGQAQDIVENHDIHNSGLHSFDRGTGEILNNTSVMEFNPSSGVLSANFRNMSLRRIKRSDRRGTDTVTEEKFSVLFFTTFKVANNEIGFVVRALSLPLVVIVHGNQESNASASILWDNAFSLPGRTLFHVPDKVKWTDLVETLSSKWRRDLNCRFDLSPRAISYLGQKIFRGQACTADSLVSWSMFNRENMPARAFTFWQWFDSAMALMKNKLCVNHWNDRAIVGFIDRAECEAILKAQRAGTFLMRFSDSEMGAISYAYNLNGDIIHLKPQTQRDFTVKPLYSQLHDLGQFVYCYTENDAVVLKDELFGKYYQEDQESNAEDGTHRYQSLRLVTHMDTTKGWPKDPTVVGNTTTTSKDLREVESPHGSMHNNPITFNMAH